MHLPEQWRAIELAERLTALGDRAGGMVTDADREAIAEAIRRLKQHEILVEEVLPELRARTQRGLTGPVCCP